MVTSSTCSAPRERCRVREVSGATYAPAPLRKRFTSLSPVAATQWGSRTCRLPMSGSNSGAYNSSRSAAWGLGFCCEIGKLVRNHLRERPRIAAAVSSAFRTPAGRPGNPCAFPRRKPDGRATGKRAPGRNRFHDNTHRRRAALPRGRTDSRRPACAAACAMRQTDCTAAATGCAMFSMARSPMVVNPSSCP